MKYSELSDTDKVTHDAAQAQVAADEVAREAAVAARKAKRKQILKRTNAQGLPELRAKLNELIEFLGGES